MIGLLFTGWSFLRSNRIAQYALVALVVVIAILAYGRSKRKQGLAEAAAKAAERVIANMEKKREIHREIVSLPLSERARRLRDLDRRQ